jgi:hypothetical protein
MKKRQNTGWVLGLVSFLLILGSPFTGGADSGNILTKFQPYITVQEEYISNLFLTNKNKKDDFITAVYPGLRFSTLPRSATTRELRQISSSADENYGLDLDFVAGYVYYAKHHNLSYFSPSGTLNAWYTWNRRLTFKAREYLTRSEDPREQDYTSGAMTDQYLLASEKTRSIYLRNVFEPSIDYQFGKESHISINYRNNIYRNQSVLSENSQENFINPRFIHWFNIRNGISFEYGLTLGNFEQSPDLTGHMGTGRYTYRFNPRTSIFGEYTFLRRTFESPGIDYDVHRPTLGIEHAFSPTLSAKAQLGYFWENPQKGSRAGGLFYDIGLTQRSRRTTYTLLFQGGYAEDYFTAENLGFTKSHRAIGTISHQLAEKMSVGLRGSLERPIYSSGEKDWIWGVSGNLSYQVVRWLNLSLEGSHRENHSNIDNRDYSEYRGLFKLTAAY